VSQIGLLDRSRQTSGGATQVIEPSRNSTINGGLVCHGASQPVFNRIEAGAYIEDEPEHYERHDRPPNERADRHELGR
jgi:hypothetical protein